MSKKERMTSLAMTSAIFRDEATVKMLLEMEQGPRRHRPGVPGGIQAGDAFPSRPSLGDAGSTGQAELSVDISDRLIPQ